ncbi:MULTISPECIES: PAS domain-containing protein [unclassified Microcoleus]|uniref:PAS domain-containing protein n=1 Tax=unclassified Microcoleus TaxID=2642155 RepID=UPI0040408CC4
MAMLMRSHDWSQTPLGAVETWSDSVKTAVQIMLTELDRTQQPDKTQLESNLPQERPSTDVLPQTAQADAFRVRLTNGLRPLTDANEIQATAARILGDSLGASRVIYIEVLPGGKEVIVHKNYTNGVAELSGLYHLEDFGRNLTDDHRAGRTAIVPDVANYSKYTASQKAMYQKIDIAAHIDVPLIKNDRFVALLALHQANPRPWTKDEVKRVEETAEQTWAAVERARAEAALRESRTELEGQLRKFDAIVAAIPDFIYTFNLAGRFTYVSPALLNLWLKTSDEALGKNFFELDYPTDLATRHQQQIQQVIATRQPLKDESLYTSAIGTRAYEYIFVPLLGINGAVDAVAGVTRDITERKRAEQALRESEEQTRNILESIAEAFFALDDNWRFTYVNRSAGALLDRAPGNLIGKNLWEEYPGLIGHELEQIHWSAMRDRVAASMTAFYPHHDRWYEVRTYPAPNGITVYFKNVTEQIQTAATLRQSEERYRTLFESIDEGFCIIEVLFDENDTPIDYRFLEINPTFEQQTGLQQAVGKTARQLVPDLEDHWIQIYGQVALTGEPTRFENGSEPMNRWFDVYACRMGEQEARKVAVVFKDISDRKRAEEVLRRNAEFNAFRVSLADALRPLADPGEIQATASRVLGEYLGANRVAYFEVRGADYVVERDYVNGAEPLAGGYSVDSFGPKLLAAYRSGRAVSASDVEADPNLSPDQRSAYAAIQIGAYIGIPLIKEGEFVAGLAVHTSGSRAWTPDEVSLAEEVADRTWAAVERARAEAALRDSEELKQRILESSKDCIKVLTLDSEIVYISTGGLRLLEIDDPTLVLNACWLDLWKSEDYENAKRAIAAAKAGNTGQFQGYLPTYKGTPKWWDSIITPVRNTAGEVTQLVAISRDITKQKQAETERERLLAQEQVAREAADRANQIKDEFLAVLSHELRSPLNPILGWSKLLQQGKLDAAKTTMALETIERNARLQVQLIDDLLDISRILRGKLSLTVMPVDLSAVISEALETVRLAAEAKAIQIYTKILPSVGIVIGDAGRLQQVVWNLLSNAVKFTPHQGQVAITLTLDETHAQIQVTDTGKGIRSDFLPYVFEHFRQEDGATTRKFGGLGLGLAIVQQIVELHGGTVTVDSFGEGQGATFTVRIPLAPRYRELPAIEQPHDSTGDLSGIHVLVVDDDADSREFVAFVLEQATAIVTAVACGTEALQAFSQAVPDIIVSDIGMPEMDGYMLLRHIRSLPLEQGGQIPAIALTAYAGEMDRQQAIAAGFQRHLAKPVDPEAVVAIITKLLSSENWV